MDECLVQELQNLVLSVCCFSHQPISRQQQPHSPQLSPGKIVLRQVHVPNITVALKFAADILSPIKDWQKRWQILGVLAAQHQS